MPVATPQIRNVARRIISDELRTNKSSEGKIQSYFSACEKLRLELTTYTGNGGFRALLSRALALAKAEVPWLRTVQVNANGTLEEVEGAKELHAQHATDKRFEGRVVLLAQLLGLLVAFIGENLTLRLVREVWPKALLDESDFGSRGKNEKTR